MMTTNKTKLDRILTKHARWASDLVEQPLHQYPDATLTPKQAKAAIKALVLEMIGEDEDKELFPGIHYADGIARNKLRQELREKVNEL